MKLISVRQNLFIILIFTLSFTVSGTSFIDEHNDESLTDWGIVGDRPWREINSAATPRDGTNKPGFLINSRTVGPNGTIQAIIKADKWNGDKGGIVFRWTSTTSYYYVAIKPAQSNSSFLKLVKNSVDANSSSAITVAQKFSVGTTYTLKIVIKGDTFSFYTDGILRGSVIDASLTSGSIGYGYNPVWTDYIDFDRLQWTEDSTDAPVSPSLLVVKALSSSQINLSWQDNSNDEIGFKIERASGSSNFQEIKRVTSNTTSFQDTGLQQSTLYRYRIRSYTTDFNSTYSNVASETTLPGVTNDSITIKTNYNAMVIIYDPLLGNRYGNKKLSYYSGYRNADTLVNQYCTLLRKASGGQVNFTVDYRYELDEFAPETDPNVEFTRDSCIEQWKTISLPLGSADYYGIAHDPRFGIIDKVNSADIDAVWIFATPNSGFWETCMAGPGAYWVNGLAYPNIGTTRKFVFYGFGREGHQNVGFMCENTGHMTEWILGKIADTYWPRNKSANVWNTLNLNNSNRTRNKTFLHDMGYFILTDAVSFNQSRGSASGEAQCGLSHFPPTAIHNYDWSQNHYLNWGECKQYGGTWSQTGENISVNAGTGYRIVAHDSRTENDGTQYMVPIIASDFTCKFGIKTSRVPATHSGVLLRVSVFSNTVNDIKGYYVGLNGNSNRLFISKLKNGVQQLAYKQINVDTSRLYILRAKMVRDTIEIDTGNGTPLISVIDNEYTDGGVGYITFGTAATFAPLMVKPAILTGAENWYNYPALSSDKSRITSELEYEGQFNDNFITMTHFYSWWYEHLPKNSGLISGKDSISGALSGNYLATWWPYIFDINTFDGTPITRNVIFPNLDSSIPQPVSNIQVSDQGAFIYLSWDEPYDNVGVTRYEIYRNGELVKIACQKEYQDHDVRLNQNYSYTIIARDGSANKSNPVSTVEITKGPYGIPNGDFELSNVLWTQDAWLYKKYIMKLENMNGINNSKCISVQNIDQNDSRWILTIPNLTPNANYVIRGYIKGENIIGTGSSIGASICIMGTYNYSSPAPSGTFDWTPVELHFQAPVSGETTIGCRLGFYGTLATGKAWFDNLTVSKEP